MSFLLSLILFFNKIKEQGGTGSAWKWERSGVRGVAQTICTHVSKCKNDKIKDRKKLKKRNSNRKGRSQIIPICR
jgi:hypothetical protein